jgi:hypothetical protein
MLYYGFYIDESRKLDALESYNATESVILTDRGEWDIENHSTILNQHSYYHRTIFGFPQIFYVNPKNMSFCLPGYVNRIVTFNNDSTTDVYRFMLASNDSEVLEKYMKEESFENISTEDLNSDYLGLLLKGPYLENIYNIIVDKSTISFRVNYYPKGLVAEEGVNLLYWVHNESGTKAYKSLRIPGLAMDIEPTGCHDNRNVAIIENLGEDAIDENAKMSPLAQQIIDELKKQNDDNPVLLEFRFK